jgi:transcriptional regulator GlxA family with amidase domain
MDTSRALLPLVLALTLGARAGVARQDAASFVCPPCGAECHFTTYPKEGNCGGCGMELVPLASVPQVGVLLGPRSALVSSSLALAAFSASNTVRAFTVSDTIEPLRLADTLEVRPQFAFADVPRLDVLVVPESFGAWDDPLVVEWVKGAAEKARCVIGVGAGSILLAKAGFLAGQHIPGRKFLVERGKQLAPELVFVADVTYRRAGKFFLARDGGATIEACLAVVAEIAGDERARRTAEEFGVPWTPEQK